MATESGASIMEHFGSLTDPRIDRTKRHKLLDIVTIAICGAICGADNWVEIELFGGCKKEWFQSFLELPNGIPSHDTFGDVFARLDPEEFQRAFMAWVEAIAEVTRGQVIAIDGKAVRRSHDQPQGKRALHLVNVWASSNGLVLGQAKVAEKSNEITAIPELLRLLDLSGCIVTIDAMGCQRETAAGIVEAGADYVLAVKQNQRRLYNEVVDLFEAGQRFNFDGIPHDFAETVNKGHGRVETRSAAADWAIADPQALAYLQDRESWPGLRAVAKVTAQRCIGEKVTVESRYYITSLPGNAQQLLQAIRAHWGIENSLHWVLDIAFREDESRIRKDHGPENFALLRQIALNLLKQETTGKHSIKSKRLKAGWQEDYLLKALLD